MNMNMYTSTHTEAFAAFKVKPTNFRWSWAGISEDGKTVVLTFWAVDFSAPQGMYTGSCRVDHRPGSREWLECLRWAQAHCGGYFGVILAVAKDEKAGKRSIGKCCATTLWMKITSIDEEAGIFTAKVLKEDFALAA